jgi:4-hydroxy-3-polyprenylbenzoate decarboxylase
LPEYGVAHNLVLIKAKTAYEGQSIKIMNALLGAGQMMFSKVIICFNENFNINNDQEILYAISTCKNLVERITFTKGPADILDHAAYKYSFSGKILIDLTDFDSNNIGISSYPNTFDERIIFHQNGLVVLMADASIEKTNLDQAKEFLKANSEDDFSILAIVDNFNFKSVASLLPWYILNNLDPSHDCTIENNVLIIDAGIKTLKKNNFKRDWPNIVCSNEITISKIDKIWEQIGCGSLVESPSTKLIPLTNGNSAVLNKN